MILQKNFLYKVLPVLLPQKISNFLEMPLAHPTVYMMTNKMRSNPDRVVASLKNRKRTNKGYQLAYLIICATPDLCPGETQDRNKDQSRSFTTLEIYPRAPASIVYRPQIPTLIDQFLLEACIPRDLMIPGLISVSAPGTCKLDQGYSMKMCNILNCNKYKMKLV
jgi:hypothetical protein